MTEKRVTITDINPDFHHSVLKPIFRQLFGVKTVISSYKTAKGNTTYRTRINSKSVYKLYSEAFSIPEGKDKTYRMETPKEMLSVPNDVIGEYIRGWMDAEGWVTLKKSRRNEKIYISPRIALNIVNRKMRDELCSLIKKLGIHVTTWDSKKIFGFQIIGIENVTLYADLIGFRHPDKIKKLSYCLSEAKRGLQCA